MEMPRSLAILTQHLWSRPRLERFVDAELSTDDHRRVGAHLRDCDDCAAEVAALLGLKQALRDRLGLAPSAKTRARLEAWISREVTSVLA